MDDSTIDNEVLLYCYAERSPLEVAVRFRLIKATLVKDGSVYLTIFRHGQILGFSSADDPITDTRSTATQAVETRISIHPGEKPTITFIKSHATTKPPKGSKDLNKDSRVFLSDSLKTKNLFIPIAMVATGMPAKANVLDTVDVSARPLLTYNPMASQLRTMIFVSNANKEFDTRALAKGMKYHSFKMGIFNIHTISLLWPYPSTNDGTVLVFGTSRESGPQSNPIDEAAIVSCAANYFTSVNKRLLQYINAEMIADFGIPVPHHAQEWP